MASNVIATPCVRICGIDPQHGLCIGCYRTLEEICDWRAMSAEARDCVMAQLPERRRRLKEGPKPFDFA